VEYIIITLLQIVCRVCRSKNSENWSIIGEDMDKSKVPRFLWPTVYMYVCQVSTHNPGADFAN